MAHRSQSPTLTVRLTKGLADRKRLPLDHVIRTLTELKLMLAAAGRSVARERNLPVPVELGLELVAGFRAGSVQATLAITNEIAVGVEAARAILYNAQELGGVRKGQKTGPAAPDVPARLMHHWARLAAIQRADKTEMRLRFQYGGKQLSATFGDRAVNAVVREVQPRLEQERLVLYGHLFELKDDSGDLDEESVDEHFGGELRNDDGSLWRLRFRQRDLPTVGALFSQRVMVSGRARYYKVASPRLLVDHIEVDQDRDYLAAFDKIFGVDRDVYEGNLSDILRRQRGRDE